MEEQQQQQLQQSDGAASMHNEDEREVPDFDPAAADAKLDKLTAHVMRLNHTVTNSVKAKQSGQYRKTSFLVHLATNSRMRTAGGSHKGPIDFSVNITESLKRVIPDDMPTACFVASIEAVSASNKNADERTLYLHMKNPANSSLMVKAKSSADDSHVHDADERTTAILALPHDHVLSNVGQIYDASRFAQTDTFTKYSTALDKDIKEFLSTIKGTQLVSYVSPYSLSAEERAAAVDAGHTTANADAGDNSTVNVQDDGIRHTHNDWFVDLMYRNTEAFTQAPIASLRTGLGDESIVTFEMLNSDFNKLHRVVENEVLRPLQENMLRCNGESMLQFSLEPESEGVQPERDESNWPKQTNFNALLRVTVGYI